MKTTAYSVCRWNGNNCFRFASPLSRSEGNGPFQNTENCTVQHLNAQILRKLWPHGWLPDYFLLVRF